ncbi:MAG TPA: sodium:proton antiporter [Gemmataceae bacterium]|jgi:Na+/H+ antiporter NhaD/arsenite permease-like protein|nr:sodium:proton antiporter [Gemmataceae bacterium]
MLNSWNWKASIRGLRVTGAAFVGLLLAPSFALGTSHEPLKLPVWSIVPFVLLLLCIASLPLVAEHFWHNDRNKAVIVLCLAIPVILYLGYMQLSTGEHTLYPLVHELGKYSSFIIMLGSLYAVAGGIVVRGDLKATPFNNAVILGLGALLANLIGTTGASVLLIRPYLRINALRKLKLHLPVFFIFLVSNLGGCLTPLGDPPLFMGYLNGVPFQWTLTLWPQWLLVNGLVLAVFVVWDTISLRREAPSATIESDRPAPLRIDGKFNLFLLAGIMLAVVIETDWIPQRLTGVWEIFGGELLMLIMAFLSLRLTPKALREANGFNWRPITEVAILFAGIFVTMVPALQLLEVHGRSFGLTEPWQFFWVTGLLSAGLDNAPTYLAFATLSAGSDDFNVLVENLAPGLNGPRVLQAISCGAVFMGALSYIGNGPNFMVKAISEQAGYRLPSFFGYTLYASAILIPIYILVTVIFFR